MVDLGQLSHMTRRHGFFAQQDIGRSGCPLVLVRHLSFSTLASAQVLGQAQTGALLRIGTGAHDIHDGATQLESAGSASQRQRPFELIALTCDEHHGATRGRALLQWVGERAGSIEHLHCGRLVPSC